MLPNMAAAARDKAVARGFAKKAKVQRACECHETTGRHRKSVWFAPAGNTNEGNKHFIDFQNDVTVADLELAQREGYE